MSLSLYGMKLISMKQGHVKYDGMPNLTRGHDPRVWFVTLPEDVRTDDSIRMKLVECNGQEWEVGPFLPFPTRQDAKRK